MEIASHRDKELKWKVDLKGLPPERYKAEKNFCANFIEKTSNEQRALIIATKKQLLYYDEKQKMYRTQKNSSYHIYDMVINDNYVDPNKIIIELRSRGII